MKKLISPFDSNELLQLHAGETVLVSGIIYTARDAAHGRLTAALASGNPLPVNLRGQTIYYAGPTPTPPDRASGAIGPTTSMRMDPYTPALLDYGVKALIGKGDRSDAVKRSLMQNGAVYFAAIGGCAAYMSTCVEKVEVIAYDDLGTESIKRLVVRDMPLTVAIDAHGNDAYEQGVEAYLQSIKC